MFEKVTYKQMNLSEIENHNPLHIVVEYGEVIFTADQGGMLGDQYLLTNSRTGAGLMVSPTAKVWAGYRTVSFSGYKAQ